VDEERSAEVEAMVVVASDLREERGVEVVVVVVAAAAVVVVVAIEGLWSAK
jgi:hypothetical protein